jgi:hypothetical protein
VIRSPSRLLAINEPRGASGFSASSGRVRSFPSFSDVVDHALGIHTFVIFSFPFWDT